MVGLEWKIPLKCMICGYLYFRKPPYVSMLFDGYPRLDDLGGRLFLKKPTVVTEGHVAIFPKLLGSIPWLINDMCHEQKMDCPC